MITAILITPSLPTPAAPASAKCCLISPSRRGRLMRDAKESAVAVGYDGWMTRTGGICQQWGRRSPLCRCMRSPVERRSLHDYSAQDHPGGEDLDVAATFFRRDDHNNGAVGSGRRVGCRGPYPKAAHHRPGNHGALCALGSLRPRHRTRYFGGPNPRWLRRKAHPRPPHKSMSWTGRHRPLNTTASHRKLCGQPALAAFQVVSAW